jgi:riboflavin synthase
MLVAYTQQHIALPRKPAGSRVNLEVDILSKYVEKFIGEVNYATRRN